MIEFLQEQAAYAHFYIFGLFMLAGFCVPISEDVLFIAAATIAVTLLPENEWILFVACFAGAYISDVVCFFLGRTLGWKLLTVRPFDRLVSKKQLTAMMGYYEKYGIYTLLFGRFIPFGVRNAIFLTSGISRMNPVKFMTIDLVACSVTSIILFSLGKAFASNYETLFAMIRQFNLLIFAALVCGLGVFLLRRRQRRLS